jgi:anti-anti-sigma factor
MDSAPGRVALVVTHDGVRPVCRVRGEIDAVTCTAVAKVLFSFVEIGEDEIELDLSEVEAIDSRGVTQLVAAHQAGLKITITAASPAAQIVLDSLGRPQR